MNHLLRDTHEALVETSAWNDTIPPSGRLIIFLVSYGILVIVALTWLRFATCELSMIMISPSECQQWFIYISIIVLQGVIGVYAVIDSYWILEVWLAYGLCNLFIAAFIFIYQLSSTFSLPLSAIVISIASYVFAVFILRLGHD